MYNTKPFPARKFFENDKFQVESLIIFKDSIENVLLD